MECLMRLKRLATILLLALPLISMSVAWDHLAKSILDPWAQHTVSADQDPSGFHRNTISSDGTLSFETVISNTVIEAEYSTAPVPRPNQGQAGFVILLVTVLA